VRGFFARLPGSAAWAWKGNGKAANSKKGVHNATQYYVQSTELFFFGEEWFRLAPFSQLSLAVTSRHKILFSSQILHSVYFCLV